VGRVRFAVEAWSPDYGSPVEDDALAGAASEVDAAVEVHPDRWAPVPVAIGVAPLGPVLFVDGVRRVEAHVWVTAADDSITQAICASYAAGAVLCDGVARLADARVERGMFGPVPEGDGIRTRHAEFVLDRGRPVRGDDPGDLPLRLQRAMFRLEARVAAEAPASEVVLVDGPLRAGHGSGVPGRGAPVVGYVKTHHKAYGPPVVRDVITRLAVGERTPLLLVTGVHPRFTWYHRLPGEHRHGWDGIVRLELSAGHGRDAAVALAERLGRTLGRFASVAAKDPRAPQNLYPVGGLERELRRRLGDPALLYRSLRAAAAAADPAGPPVRPGHQP
jgi:hypothetical protein